MSKCIVIVGATGTGKTSEVCKILEQITIPLLIFDVNNEEKYRRFRNTWNKDVNIKNFVSGIVGAKVQNTCIVFEEATIFFSHGGSTEQIKQILVQKRHTKNLLIFNFHSLRQVPLYILDFCDLLIIGKTIDNTKNIEEKFKDFEEIYQAFTEVKADANKFIKKYVRLLN